MKTKCTAKKLFMIIPAIVTIASVLAAFTPTQSDDKVIDFVANVIHTLSLDNISTANKCEY